MEHEHPTLVLCLMARPGAEVEGKRSADHTFREREEPFSVAFQEV